MPPYTYIEVIEFKSSSCIKRIEVTGKTNRQIDRIEAGLNINLNHKNYYTSTEHYSNPQPLIA